MVLQVAIRKDIGPYHITVNGKKEEVQDILVTIEEISGVINEIGQGIETTESSRRQTPEVPSISRNRRLSDAISELFYHAWGSEPRGIGEVKDALATNGLIYPLSSLSGTLLSLTKRGALRRIKTQQGYRYIRGNQ